MARHFSMLREFHLPDLFTLGNGACGTAAVFCAIHYVETPTVALVWTAAGFIVLGLVCDVLDGRIARMRHQASPFGRELDSLADVVSFGVAPAALARALGFDTVLDGLVLVYFAACGISRLARYNVTAESLASATGKVEYFEGTPIPTSLVLVFLLAGLAHAGRVGDALPGGVVGPDPLSFHPLVLLFALSGSLMISKTLHIPKP